MRRILASLFVIACVVGLGIVATGAYFTDTITQDNYTFTTSTADLKFAFCGPEGIDCSSTGATLDNYTFSTAQTTGPGQSASGCLVIENTGPYALALSTQLFVTSQTNPDMDNFFEVRSDVANSSCQATSIMRDWASAETAAGQGMVPSGITLAPGDRLYVITRNRWNSSGDQNYLQNQTLKLKTVIEGRTS